MADMTGKLQGPVERLPSRLTGTLSSAQRQRADIEKVTFNTAEGGWGGMETMRVSSGWLDGVSLPHTDPDLLRRYGEHIADILIKNDLCNTLPIYIINGHGAFEPRVEMKAPGQMSAAQEREEREYSFTDQVRAGFIPVQATGEKREGFAVEEDLFILGQRKVKGKTKQQLTTELKSLGKKMPAKEVKAVSRSELEGMVEDELVPSFVISVSPPGIDTSCGDSSALRWLGHANLDSVRSCLLSDTFLEIIPFDSTLSSPFIPPGYPCFNKGFQFYEKNTTTDGTREKWGVINLTGLSPEQRVELTGLNERYDQGGAQTQAQMFDQLYPEHLRGEDTPKMRKLWKRIEQCVEHGAEMPLSEITETLGPGIYIEMSCSGTLLKVWDPKPASTWRDLKDEIERVKAAQVAHEESIKDLEEIDKIAQEFLIKPEEVLITEDGWDEWMTARDWAPTVDGDAYIEELTRKIEAMDQDREAERAEPHFINFLPDAPITNTRSYIHAGPVFRAIMSDSETIVRSGRLGWDQVVAALSERSSTCNIKCPASPQALQHSQLHISHGPPPDSHGENIMWHLDHAQEREAEKAPEWQSGKTPSGRFKTRADAKDPDYKDDQGAFKIERPLVRRPSRASARGLVPLSLGAIERLLASKNPADRRLGKEWADRLLAQRAAAEAARKGGGARRQKKTRRRKKRRTRNAGKHKRRQKKTRKSWG